MKSRLVNGKTVFEIDEEMCKKMLQLANEALVNTYPKSGAGYAVSLLTKKGTLYQGVSYGSDTATLTMHSEATALANAAIHGERDIIAITGPNCHICKQLIYESSLRSGIDTVIIIQEGEKILQVPISTLMPYPWPEKPLS